MQSTKPSEEPRDELARLREDLEQERRQRRSVELELARVNALYQETILSTSWRFTHPLRVAGISVRHGLAGLGSANHAARRRARSALALVQVKASGLARRWETAIGDRIPYPVGMRLLARVYDLPLPHRWLFRTSLEELRRARAGAARTVERKQEERRHLFFAAFHTWWLRRAGRSRWDEIRPWFPMTGLDRLERALGTGKGVILLNAHFGGGRLVPLILVHLGFEILSIEYRDRMSELGATVDRERLTVIPLRDAFMARVAMQAVRRLRAGKIVHLAGDGFDTTAIDAIRQDFLGRRRRFTKGFAEMAVETGAAVLPLFAPFDDRGRVQIEILEPLDPGSEAVERNRRIEGMVRQYVQLLEERWKTDFGNVNTPFLETFYLNSEPT